MHTYTQLFAPCQRYRRKQASGRLLQSDHNIPLQKSLNIGGRRCLASSAQNYCKSKCHKPLNINRCESLAIYNQIY